MTKRLSTTMLLLGLFVAAPAFAGHGNSENEQGHDKKHKAETTHASADAKHGYVISTQEQTVLREYFSHDGQANSVRLNKGMQKRLESGKGLPPGWQKRLSKGHPVPDDVWRERQPLPTDILRRLPPAPQGVITVRIDNDIVRVVEATQVLLDVFQIH